MASASWGENLVEDNLRKAGGPRALRRNRPSSSMRWCKVRPSLPRQERLAAKDQRETPSDNGRARPRADRESCMRSISQKLLSDGTRARVIEPPSCPISEYAPAKLALGQVVCPAQVAEHLGRRCGLIRVARGRAASSTAWIRRWRGPYSYRFHSLVRSVSPILGRSVRKQQPVRYVFAPLGAQVFAAASSRSSRAGAETGQIRSSSVWVSLGLPSVGKRSKSNCHLALE